MPVWHTSVSVWDKHGRQVSVPELAEKEAVRTLMGVGGDREWWIWNEDAKVGHLRVAVTVEENEMLPPGMAEHDAGNSGPERGRRYKP